jgi:hypothetical protein
MALPLDAQIEIRVIVIKRPEVSEQFSADERVNGMLACEPRESVERPRRAIPPQTLCEAPEAPGRKEQLP